MLSMTATSRAVPETSCLPASGSPLPPGGWAQPAGCEASKVGNFTGRTIPTHDTLTTGIRGRRPTSSLDRWTG